MNETTDATAIFAPLWRRKWLILAVGILAAAGTYAYYKGAQRVYSATTQLYLGAGAEEQQSEKGITKNGAASNENQIALINSIVVESVRQRLRREHRGAVVRGSVVSAKAAAKSEFITISAEAHTGKGAILLANAVAQAYITRQHATQQRSITTQIGIARLQLRRIEAASVPKAAPTPSSSKGTSSSSGSPSTVTSASPNTATVIQEANLNSKINQLESSLLVAGAEQIKPAKAAKLLSPNPKQNAIFGFVIGLALAAVAAYALSRFDRRLRSLASIGEVFQSQILTALPAVRRPIVHRDGQPVPSKLLLEPLRRLHTVLQLGVVTEHERDTSCRLVLFVSADAGDGKSTLVADLALVHRDAGERVAVVEANLRRPVQAELLDVDGVHGLAEVLAGTFSIEEAMQRVQPVHASAPADAGVSAAGVATAVESRSKGSLFLLAGGAVANPPALLAGEKMTDVLRSLAEDFDRVLIDAPSPLEVSDAIPLLQSVDAIVIVARAGHTRELSAQRLVQLLAHAASAPVLGTAANCVARKDMNRYGFATRDGRVWPGTLIGR